MNFNEFKNAVIAKCQEMGIADYELYYQVGGSTSVDTFMHEINEFSSSLVGGVCLRCIVGGKMGGDAFCGKYVVRGGDQNVAWMVVRQNHGVSARANGTFGDGSQGKPRRADASAENGLFSNHFSVLREIQSINGFNRNVLVYVHEIFFHLFRF